jgi:hypothetical protein
MNYVNEKFFISGELSMRLLTGLQRKHSFLVMNGFGLEDFPLCFNGLFQKKKVSKFLRPNPKAFRLANKVFFYIKKMIHTMTWPPPKKKNYLKYDVIL